ncbi:MAG: F0F1 ATP synthase subunit delta [Planctomycetaceae bacterium]|nr:F0F1 ATP synthase subunit delta [Planctomycetales bacterium]MCB9874318.1 F0F1 ATP synthase subunit delta [Planctomycetaceae bacterium]MCB9941529.1 F0F1 ATP synthase subunit delta [Planctomycetaceae bacterium]
MSPTLTTFLFEAVNFIVLTAVLGWLFFKPVRQALSERRAKFEAETQQAAQKLAEAERMQRDIDATRANLQAELNELRSRELESVRRQAEQILTEARIAAERQREISRRQAAQMSETQRDTLAEVAATAAAETVGRLFEQIGGPELQSALIESACQQLRSLPQRTIAPVKIESALPLSPEQLAALNDALGPAASGADFRTVDGLGAGVRIATGQGLIDASVSGLTQFARQSLVQEMKRLANNHNPLQSVNDA